MCSSLVLCVAWVGLGLGLGWGWACRPGYIIGQVDLVLHASSCLGGNREAKSIDNTKIEKYELENDLNILISPLLAFSCLGANREAKSI